MNCEVWCILIARVDTLIPLVKYTLAQVSGPGRWLSLLLLSPYLLHILNLNFFFHLGEQWQASDEIDSSCSSYWYLSVYSTLYTSFIISQ